MFMPLQSAFHHPAAEGQDETVHRVKMAAGLLPVVLKSHVT